MSEDLAQKKCTACHGNVPGLESPEIDHLLDQLQGWSIIKDNGVKKLVKNYPTPDFAQAMKMANRVADIVEAEGHHPDLLVRWGNLAITIWTHAVNGLTENDFILAAKIDGIE
jgi:4a-hydroxytetrahydrobiopterin dehydratase